MKICSYSPKYKKCLPFILDDNKDDFLKNEPEDFSGQIDGQLFLNFCIESNSIKIIKYILSNQLLRKTIKINNNTFILLLKNKKITTLNKKIIYKKLSEINYLIEENKLFKLVCQYDKNLLYCLRNINNISKEEYKNLFIGAINEVELKFCRYKNLNIVDLLLQSHQKEMICFENYDDLLSEVEVIKLINESFKLIHKKDDINLLDSILKILMKKPYLIEKVNISLLNKLKVNLILFHFLNMDIEKVLLYKKYSNKKHKEKIKKI